MNQFTTDEESRRNQILNSKFYFNDDFIKGFFPKLEKTDYEEIKELLHKKVDFLKMELRTYHPSSLHRMTADEFADAMTNYINELNVEYDKYGLKKTYDKITKVLEVIPQDFKHKDDLEIIQEIKKEYISTKKLNKSSMLYLNKIYRQLSQENVDEKNGKEFTKEQLGVEFKKLECEATQKITNYR